MACWRLVFVATLAAGLWLSAPTFATTCDDDFITKPMDVVVAIGEIDKMECVYVNSQFAEQWQRDGTSIGDNDDVCNCSIDEDGSLVFNNPVPEEAGLYECFVQTGFGETKSCTARLTIADPPNITSISGPGGGANRREIVALVEGNPLPDTKWLHNGDRISSGGDISISSVIEDDNLQRVTLTIANPEPNDRGTYTLVANNSANTTSHNWTVAVEFVEVTTFMKRLDSETFVCTGHFYHPIASVTVNFQLGTTPLDSVSFGQKFNAPLQQYEFEANWNFLDSCQDVVNNLVRCQAQLGDRLSSLTTSLCESLCNEPTMTLKPVNCSSIEVTLDGQLDSYMLKYRPSSSSEGDERTHTIFSRQVNITNLMEDTEYEFSVSCGSEMFFNPMKASTLVVAPMVEGVNVARITRTNAISFKLTWQESPDSAVSGYRVNVTFGDQHDQMVVSGRESTEFELENIQCELKYMFQVAAVNPCGEGNYSATVQHSCDTPPSPTPGRVSFNSLVPSSTVLTLKFSLQLPGNVMQFTVVVEEQDSKQASMIFKYDISRELFQARSVCIGGLTPETQLRVCLQAEYNDIDGVLSICQETMTAEKDEEEDSSLCLSPSSSRVISDDSADSNVVVPDWAVAVIVVGALVIFAMMFCLLGFCFACNTSRNKDLIYSSTTSLDMHRDNMAPFHMHNPHPSARAVSPSRSCLKYHRERGHSTTWNDTIRQLDTDNGTHV